MSQELSTFGQKGMKNTLHRVDLWISLPYGVKNYDVEMCRTAGCMVSSSEKLVLIPKSELFGL